MDRNLIKLEQAKKIQAWVEKKGHLPRSGKDATEEEKALFVQMCNIRSSEESKKKSYEREEAKRIIDELYKNYKECKYLEYLKELEEWSKRNERLPKQSREANEEEQNLAVKLSYIRTWLKSPSKTYGKEEARERIRELDLTYGENTPYLLRAKKLKEWVERKGYLPRQSKDANEEEEELANVLRNIKQGLRYEENIKGKEETRKIIEELDKKYGHIYYSKKSIKEKQIIEIKLWTEKNKRFPTQAKGADEYEKKLAVRLSVIRNWLKDGIESASRERVRKIIEELDEKYEASQYLINARNIQKWASENSALPTQKKSASEEEKKLAIKLHSIRTWLKDEKEVEDKEETRKIIEELDAKYGKRKAQEIGQATYDISVQECDSTKRDLQQLMKEKNIGDK